jgi:hypothetical protein
MGDGSDDRKGSDLPPNRHYSQQFDDYRRKEENKARLAAWMQGREPVEEWESLGGLDFILYMKFPGVDHDVIVFEHLIEWGRLVVWCFGCWRKDCGACRWAESLYRKELRTKRTLQRGDKDDDLPF